MIGRRPHPTKADQVVFVPLHRSESAVWSSLASACDEEITAARKCAQVVAGHFQDIAMQARILRALCEHPEFEFEFAGLDTDTVRAQAQRLDEMIRAQVDNLDRLMDTPEPEDFVRVGGVPMTANFDGMLALREQEADDT